MHAFEQPSSPESEAQSPAQRTAAQVENEIRHLADTVGVFIHPDGSIVLRRQGQHDRVGFAESELAVMQGMTFTHNHPGGLGPSAADIAFASSYQLHELRVVTPHFHHVVLDVPGHSRHYWSAAYAGAMRKVQPHIVERVKSARLNIRQAASEQAHQACRLLAHQHRFSYARLRA